MQTRLVNGLTATVVLLVFLIGTGAFVLSYDALYTTGNLNGVPNDKAWIWPLLIDAPLVVFTLALLISQIMRQPVKLWASLVILYTLATVGFNLSHAQPTALGWLVAIVAPVGLLLTTEALRHLAKTIIERQSILSDVVELSGQRDRLRTELDKLTGQIKTRQNKLDRIGTQAEQGTVRVDLDLSPLDRLNILKQDKVTERRQAVLSLLGDGLSEGDIAHRLNVHTKTIQRDIKALNGKARGEG